MTGNSINVRRLSGDEYTGAIELAFRVFSEYEAPLYGKDGTDTFVRDVVNSNQYRQGFDKGENRIFGGFVNDRLAGIIGMRGDSHLSLVFTETRYHRMGVASAILTELIKERKAAGITKITVNAAPFGVPFYLAVGFEPQGEEQTADGITFTPMIKQLD